MVVVTDAGGVGRDVGIDGSRVVLVLVAASSTQVRRCRGGGRIMDAGGCCRRHAGGDGRRCRWGIAHDAHPNMYSCYFNMICSLLWL